MKPIKSNKEVSFGALVDSGVPRDEIMKLKGIQTVEQFDKIHASMLEARKRVVERKGTKKKGY